MQARLDVCPVTQAEGEIGVRELQRVMLNLLEDLSEEKNLSAKARIATLNILDELDAENRKLKQTEAAFLNILEDIELEKSNVVAASCRIEMANKELDEFAYVASHDLKAPLRVIDNASRWLEEDLQEHLTDETRENMKLLRGRVRRMERLLDDLLQYSRIGRKTDEAYEEPIAGDALMENILEMLAPPPGFTVKVSPGFHDIQVRRMPAQQILMNLIGNAIKHHDKKVGTVEVTVEDRGAEYAFAVKDDGPGIPAQFHDKLFKMFQTLKPRDRVEGSGMGLAMVRKYVDVYGGTLGFESAEGKGSTFHFTWPKQQQLKGTQHEFITLGEQ